MSLRDGQSSVGGGCTYRLDTAIRNVLCFITICDYSGKGNTWLLIPREQFSQPYNKDYSYESGFYPEILRIIIN
jgi:hypothetical protein